MKTILLAVVALFINVFITACKTSNDSSSKTKVWGPKNSTSSSSGEAPPPPPSVTERVVDLVKTRGIDFPGIVTRLNYYSQEYSLEPFFKQELEQIPMNFKSVFHYNEMDGDVFCEHKIIGGNNQIICNLTSASANFEYKCGMSFEDFSSWFIFGLERQGECPVTTPDCNGTCTATVIIPHLLPLNQNNDTTNIFNMMVKWCTASGEYLLHSNTNINLSPEDIASLSQSYDYFRKDFEAGFLMSLNLKGLMYSLENDLQSFGKVSCSPPAN